MSIFLHPLGNTSYKSSLDVAEHQRRSYSANEPEWQHMHGVDLKVPKGTPVLAVTSGYISINGLGFGPPKDDNPRHEGLRCHLSASDKTDVYFYAHLSQFAPGIKPGAYVEAGTIIGYTGRANGVDHLHFAARNSQTDYILDHALKVAPATDGGKLYSDPEDGPMSVGSDGHHGGHETATDHGTSDGPMSIDHGNGDGPQSIPHEYNSADLNLSPGDVNFTPGDFSEHHGQPADHGSDGFIPDHGNVPNDFGGDPGDMGGGYHPNDFGFSDGGGIQGPGEHSGDLGTWQSDHSDAGGHPGWADHPVSGDY